jgi:phosphotriesterase-related protein
MTKSGWINTVSGAIPAEDLGLTLPHEHLFTDLRGPSVPGYAQGNPDHVVAVMKPYLDEIADLGVTALVECSTIGVGRNPVILKRLAQNTPIRIIAPTGVYREAYVPPDLKDKSANELAEMWVCDILEGIDGSDVKAGFIKMAVSDEGISDIEAKNLKAAVLASQQTGAIIASHTIGGELARQEMKLLESYGLDLNRFIWTHAQSEPDKDYHLEAVQRGAYVSIDAIGSGWAPDPDMLEYTLGLIEAGYTDKLFLSHDAGWYDPSQPDGHPEGNGIRGYTALFKSFLPALRAQGVSKKTIDQITIQNPSRAFTLNVV